MSQERFLILTRAAGPASRALERVLAPLGRVETIPDAPGAGNWYPDDLLAGYEGIMGGSEFGALTAWSRAFYHLARQPGDEAVWFVEDDVAGPPEAFRELVSRTLRRNPDLATRWVWSQQQAPDWHWWHLNPGFDPAWKSFNPICRLSPRLLAEVQAWRASAQRFCFHEILFASLACRHRLVCVDWSKSPGYEACFGRFNWRPEISEPQAGVCHPVKDPDLHARICGLRPGPGEA